jgi:carbamoyl-phosphate synthase small subunit
MTVNEMNAKACIILEDGTIFYGQSIGACKKVYVELVFTTANVGYQEVLTDPSYQGQGIVFTTPHVGMTGINFDDNESDKVLAGAAIMRSCTSMTHHPAARYTLQEFFVLHQMVAVEDVDTRALVRYIREQGTCFATIDVVPSSFETKKEAHVTLHQKEKIDAPLFTKYHIAVIDYGVKKSILHALRKRGCNITLLPPSFSYDDIQKIVADGVVLSNGPFSPYDHPLTEIKKILRAHIPTMGICLGHQLIALSLGGNVKKMIHGHRGINHPVIDVMTKKVYVTAQNHGYVVDECPQHSGLQVMMRSLIDHTIAGLRHKDLPIITFQGHPEGGAGPTDVEILFDQFLTLVEKKRCLKIRTFNQY